MATSSITPIDPPAETAERIAAAAAEQKAAAGRTARDLAGEILPAMVIGFDSADVNARWVADHRAAVWEWPPFGRLAHATVTYYTGPWSQPDFKEVTFQVAFNTDLRLWLPFTVYEAFGITPHWDYARQWRDLRAFTYAPRWNAKFIFTPGEVEGAGWWAAMWAMYRRDPSRPPPRPWPTDRRGVPADPTRTTRVFTRRAAAAAQASRVAVMDW